MSFLDRSISWLSDTIDTASSTVQSWSQEWQNAVDNFKTKSKDFLKLFETLQNRKSIAYQNEATKKEYDKLINKGGWIYSTIADIAKKLDFFQDTIGTNRLNSMGVLPLVPIAIIAGAVAVITAWMADALVLNKKLDVIERLALQGTDPVKLSESLSEGEAGLFNIDTSKYQSLLLLGVVGTVLYLAWPILTEGRD